MTNEEIKKEFLNNFYKWNSIVSKEHYEDLADWWLSQLDKAREEAKKEQTVNLLTQIGAEEAVEDIKIDARLTFIREIKGKLEEYFGHIGNDGVTGKPLNIYLKSN